MSLPPTGISGYSFFSGIIVFKKNNRDGNDIILINNPVIENISLQAIMQKAGNLQLEIINLTGKKLLHQQVALSYWINQLNIPIPLSCTRGSYILQVQGMEIMKTIRIMVLK